MSRRCRWMARRVFFQTCYDVDVHPVRLMDAYFKEAPGRSSAISVQMEITGPRLNDWHPGHLRFFLGGDFSGAADLYALLLRRLRQIVITPHEGGEALILSPDELRPAGFSQNESLFTIHRIRFRDTAFFRNILCFRPSFFFWIFSAGSGGKTGEAAIHSRLHLNWEMFPDTFPK